MITTTTTPSIVSSMSSITSNSSTRSSPLAPSPAGGIRKQHHHQHAHNKHHHRHPLHSPKRSTVYSRPLWANRFPLNKLAPDEAYLSYYDVRLMREDIDSIKDDWLTDNAIAFWEEYLEREKLVSYSKAHIVLLRPSMSFMLQNTDDPLTLKDALPSFAHTSHVFLPINDCTSVTMAEGGSHWSLLLVSIVDGVAFHYDSLSPSNYKEGKLVARKMEGLLGKPLKFVHLEDTPQQGNSMDCGVYVCLLMQHLLLEKLLRAHAGEKVSMSMRDKKVNAYGGRKEIMKIIDARRKEGERRRSRSHSPYTGGSKSPPRIGEENDDLKQ